MLGIGFGEMVLIAGIALVVIGPEKFPDFAKIVLRTVRDLRGYVDDVKQEVTKELRPVQKEIRELTRYDPETYIDAMTGPAPCQVPTPCIPAVQFWSSLCTFMMFSVGSSEPKL